MAVEDLLDRFEYQNSISCRYTSYQLARALRSHHQTKVDNDACDASEIAAISQFEDCEEKITLEEDGAPTFASYEQKDPRPYTISSTKANNNARRHYRTMTQRLSIHHQIWRLERLLNHAA